MKDALDVNRLIGCYLAIEHATRQMLAAAREGHWERVGEIQESCAELIAQVRQLNASVVLSRYEQRSKLRIIRQIVQNEAQIRRLAYPWSERYEQLVSAGTPRARAGTTGRVN